jgi:hypothetical protein
MTRRASSSHRLIFADCPACLRDGVSRVCGCCGGGRKVTLETARLWRMFNEGGDSQVELAVTRSA